MDPVAYVVLGIFVLLMLAAIFLPRLSRRRSGQS
jgi:type II secretory pathway component PulF